MLKKFIDYPIKSMVSLSPLLNFWEKNLVPECSLKWTPLSRQFFAPIKRQNRMNYPIKFYPISKCRF